jgi:hypothetical protein
MTLEKTLNNLRKINKDYKWSIIKEGYGAYTKTYLYLEGLPKSKFNSFYNDYTNQLNLWIINKIKINLYKNYKKILNGNGFLWSFDFHNHNVKIILDYYKF